MNESMKAWIDQRLRQAIDNLTGANRYHHKIAIWADQIEADKPELGCIRAFSKWLEMQPKATISETTKTQTPNERNV